jgi:hypothetical protein
LENRPAGGPVTGSKSHHNASNSQIAKSNTKSILDNKSAEAIAAVKLRTTFTLMDPIELFVSRILTEKPNKLIEK